MTSQYFWDRVAGRDPDLRAADADRERVGDRLRRAHAEGRLDMDEFQERLERCYEAKTLGQLGELVRDLPRQDEVSQARSSGWVRSWHRRLGLLAPILIAVILLSALTGHQHHLFWLWIPLVFLFFRIGWWRRRRSWAGPRRGWDDWV